MSIVLQSLKNFIHDFTAPPPVFSLDEDRYNMNSWAGRSAYFFELLNPFRIPDSVFRLEHHINNLNRFRSKIITPEDCKNNPNLNKQLWRSRFIVESSLHPDGSVIPWYGRFSFFVPVNIPILYGMLTHPTGPRQYFWQWVNQSYNCCINYANSNKGSGSTATLLQSYLLACSSAIAVVAALSPVAERVRALAPFVPYTAVATAGFVNALFSRSAELSRGAPVYVGRLGHPEESTMVGLSNRAGRIAVFKTAVSRVIIPIPIMLFTPVILRAAERIPPIRRLINTSTRRLVFQLCVIPTVIALSLPFCLAIFPKYEVIPYESLMFPLSDDSKNSSGTKKHSTSSQFFFNEKDVSQGVAQAVLDEVIRRKKLGLDTTVWFVRGL